jgi:hypothetical protein
MSTEVGKITAVLGLDANPFREGMLQATSIASIFPSTVTSFLANPLLGVIDITKQMTGALASGTQSYLSLVKQVGEAADNAGEAAQKAGAGVAFLTGAGLAAADAGGSMEAMGDSLKFLNKNISEAAGGSASAQMEFSRLGISITDQAGNLKPVQTLFLETADAIAALQSPANRTAAAMGLLGRGGTDMIPMLAQGSAEINRQIKLYADLGATIDEDLAASGDKFATFSSIVDAAWTGIRNTLARPVLGWFKNNFDDLVRGVQLGSQIVRSVIGDAFTGVAKALNLPNVGSLIGSLQQVADWVKANSANIQQNVQAAMEKIIAAVKQASSWLKSGFEAALPTMVFVKDHLKEIGIALAAFTTAKAVSEVANLATAFAGLVKNMAGAAGGMGSGLSGRLGVAAGLVAAAQMMPTDTPAGRAASAVSSGAAGAMLMKGTGPLGMALGFAGGSITQSLVNVRGQDAANQASVKNGVMAAMEVNIAFAESYRQGKKWIADLNEQMGKMSPDVTRAANDAMASLQPLEQAAAAAAGRVRRLSEEAAPWQEQLEATAAAVKAVEAYQQAIEKVAATVEMAKNKEIEAAQASAEAAKQADAAAKAAEADKRFVSEQKRLRVTEAIDAMKIELAQAGMDEWQKKLDDFKRTNGADENSINEAKKIIDQMKSIDIDKKMTDAAAQVAKELQTPAEAWDERITELNRLFLNGKISQDLLDRGIEKANEELNRATEPKKGQSAGMASFINSGSVDAVKYQAELAMMVRGDKKDYAKEQLDAAKKSERHLENIANNKPKVFSLNS